MNAAAPRLDLAWKPPGPVAAAFMQSMAPVQILCGPLGSGKTTAALIKAIRLAAAQTPSPRLTARAADGKLLPVRRFKACVVRDTYRQLWKTTIPSWFKRVPREAGDFAGPENAPATHRITFQPGDGTLVELVVDFVGIGENAAEEVLDGYEPTLFVLDAANLLQRDVFTFAVGRTGRFPDMVDGGPRWHGVLIVCNAPQFTSWLYQDLMRKPREELAAMGVDVFMQPSGFDPAAENLENLPAGYYAHQAKLNPRWYVDRLLKNLPGFDRSGRAIYADEWDDARHVSASVLQPEEGLPLLLGVDGGGSPACVFGQRGPRQLRILHELVAQQGTGPTRFGEMVARELHERFPKCRVIRGWADPATTYGGDREREGETWLELFCAASGLVLRPAPTNAPSARWEAVRGPLTRTSADGPGFLLSASCYVVREGFASGYRLKRVAGTEDKFHDEAEKNRYSHPHDALQYLALGAGEFLEVLDRHRQRGLSSAVRQVEDYDPLAIGGWGVS